VFASYGKKTMSILFSLPITICFQHTINYKKIGGSAEEMEEKKVTWLELFYDL
jgi:hypothetical protein